MRQKHRDSGIIVAICIILAALLVGVYFGIAMLRMINNGNGRDSSEFSNTTPRSEQDYEPSSSVLKVVDGGSSTTPAAAVDMIKIGPLPLMETLLFGEMTLEIVFEENPLIIASPLNNTLFLDWFVLKDNRSLYNAILKVEGDDGQLGPDGERGPYRITPAYWKDSCEQIAKVHGTTVQAIERSFDYENCVTLMVACEIIMKFYWQRYGAVTDEQKARCHNGGGPNGMNVEATKEYWQRVKNLMKGVN